MKHKHTSGLSDLAQPIQCIDWRIHATHHACACARILSRVEAQDVHIFPACNNLSPKACKTSPYSLDQLFFQRLRERVPNCRFGENDNLFSVIKFCYLKVIFKKSMWNQHGTLNDVRSWFWNGSLFPASPSDFMIVWKNRNIFLSRNQLLYSLGLIPNIRITSGEGSLRDVVNVT